MVAAFTLRGVSCVSVKLDSPATRVKVKVIVLCSLPVKLGESDIDRRVYSYPSIAQPSIFVLDMNALN